MNFTKFSNDKMMRQLTKNPQYNIKEIIDELVLCWIQTHNETIQESIKEFKTDEELLKYCENLLNPYINYSNNFSKLFGKFVKQSKKINSSHIIQIVKYCDMIFQNIEYKDELDFQQIDNIEYLSRKFGMAYCMHNREIIFDIVNVKFDNIVLK